MALLELLVVPVPVLALPLALPTTLRMLLPHPLLLLKMHALLVCEQTRAASNILTGVGAVVIQTVAATEDATATAAAAATATAAAANNNAGQANANAGQGNANAGGAAAAAGGDDFGTCDPTMSFEGGRNGRPADEFTFQSNDPAIEANQQEALNPNIITNRICDELTNICGANAAAIATCEDAQAQIQALGTRDQTTADAWNQLVGGGAAKRSMRRGMRL
jgi:hypothetical protein